MYTQLLEAVLTDEGDPADPVPIRTAGPLAELIRLRHVMERHASRADPGWALRAVADQLAYDAALVRLARRRGVPVDLAAFDIPDRGRTGLEAVLVDMGVHLSGREDTTAPRPDRRR
jgi:hypothetical protein